ncbi:hypothetical protein [Sphingomonas faeni]|uniref:hypothetical protein n=1 Tax=Sphingomonas faeni TaxID=185950 RepID=UPI002787E099|nr:hypothetical protein [Sphingomonas faeni]MDQ0838868.1 hypothetical protein [Sphingomonas faeni]
MDEVEILRGSKSHLWAHQILAQIKSRRYARFAGAADGPTPLVSGLYRVERVTRRSKYVTPKGSLINRRVADQGFETLDFTDTKTVPRRHTLPIKS